MGKGWANPTALLLSAALMLDHLGEPDAATAIREAVDEVLGAGEAVTRDLGGKASTTDYAEAVAAAVARRRG